jgi:hypothetical protein
MTDKISLLCKLFGHKLILTQWLDDFGQYNCQERCKRCGRGAAFTSEIKNWKRPEKNPQAS